MPPIFTATNKIITVSADRQLLINISEYLKVAVENRFFVVRRSHGWDGTINFFNPRNQSFSRGLWPQVRWWLRENNQDYTFRRAPTVPLDLIDNPQVTPNLILRPDQVDAINRWLKRDGFGVLWLPAGTGKTELATAALAQLSPHYKRALFLVNSLDLLLQAKERCELRLGIVAGHIGDAEWQPRRITVAMVQTLANIIKAKNDPRQEALKRLLAETDFVIGDECHHQRSKQTRSVLTRTRARFLLGLSARPFHNYSQNIQEMTAEDAIILAYLGPVAAYMATSSLIDQGQLARPQVLLIPITHPLAEGLDWPATRKQLFASQPLLDSITVLTREAAAAGQASLIVTGNSLSFNHKIYRNLINEQINAAELCGATDKLTRADARHELNQNKLEAIVATTIFDEGIDIPNLRQLILAFGGKSLIKQDQRVGRGLRKKALGSNAAVIVDYLNYGNKYLYNHSLVRLKRYLEEESYDLFIVNPEQHTPYVRRLLSDRAQILKGLPNADYYRRLSQPAEPQALAAP